MRIPTYSFRNTNDGLEVYGPGSESGNLYPNLVMIRGKNYRFISLDYNTILQIYDKSGRVLFEGDSENPFKPIIFKFGNNFPNEIFYRIKNAKSDFDYGKILIRDLDRVTGKVISYGYSKECTVYDKKYQDHTTDQDGQFELDLNTLIQKSTDTYFVNFDLFSTGGFDSAILNPNRDSYSDKLNFYFYAKAGCLNISTLSSVFYFICNKLIKVNYRDVQMQMNRYFKFSSNFDPIADDPIYCYLTNKISLDDFKKYILFTLCVELHFFLNKEQSDSDKINHIYNKIADDILNNFSQFNYDVFHEDLVYYETDTKQIKYLNTFQQLYLIIAERINSLSDTKTKKVCVLESIYSLIYKFRTATYIPKLFSPEKFLSDTTDTINDSVKIPEQKFSVLVSSASNCSVAPFGKYAKVKITQELLFSVFNQELPIEPEVTRKLIGNTLYVKYDKDSNYDYFCYTILDFIDFDYELYELNKKNSSEEKQYTRVLQGFDQYQDCCELESSIKSSDQEKNKQLEITETEIILFEAVLFDVDKNKIDTLKITNRNFPHRQYNLSEYFYIDDFLEKIFNKSQVPAFICVLNEYADSLASNGIELEFDNINRITKATQLRYDFEKIRIIDSLYQDEVLTIETESAHGFQVGDIIIIENASKDSHLNGSYSIIGLSGDKKMVLDYDLPPDVSIDKINNNYAEIRSLNITKVYTDNITYKKNQYIFFEKATNNVAYKILDIKQDYIGRYLIVEGTVPRNVNSFIRVDSSDLNSFVPKQNLNTLKYSLNTTPQRLNLKGIDTNLYKIFMPSEPGQFTKNLSSKIISSIILNRNPIIIDEPINDTTDETDIFNDDSTNELDLNDLGSYGMSRKNIPYKDEEIAYHYSRSYLKKEYDLEKMELTPENDTFDWNNDGVVGLDELKILERFLLTSPETVEEYNINRGDYPMTSVLPNIVTATYACQENCCHDDFTESETFTMEDVYIYDAFQAYMDSIGVAETDYVEFRNYYDILVEQGIAEELQNEIVYMPTTPTEQKFCGDYTGSGNISPEDAHIYYAHQLYASVNSGAQPSSVAEFSTYYNTLVEEGIVPQLLTPIDKLPSLSTEDTITKVDGDINKDCELITGKDLAIYNEWIRQGKPTDLDTFNENRLESVPRACFLPADDDGYNPGEYEDIGLGFSEQKVNEVYTGIDHL